MKKWSLMGLAAALMGTAIVGCTPEARQQYDQAGDKMSQAAEKTGQAASTDAKVTGQVIEDQAQEAKQKGDNAIMTGKVRNAIMTANDLHVEDLNVDTYDKKIVLKGNVANADDKAQAQKIAESQAGNDYTVENQITVNGK